MLTPLITIAKVFHSFENVVCRMLQYHIHAVVSDQVWVLQILSGEYKPSASRFITNPHS
jgi:hypothetical protein